MTTYKSKTEAIIKATEFSKKATFLFHASIVWKPENDEYYVIKGGEITEKKTDVIIGSYHKGKYVS